MTLWRTEVMQEWMLEKTEEFYIGMCFGRPENEPTGKVP